MGIIIREMIGWVIVIVGALLIGLVVILALNRNVFEAMALSIPSAIVFRSGIGLIRMASASRVAMKLNRERTV